MFTLHVARISLIVALVDKKNTTSVTLTIPLSAPFTYRTTLHLAKRMAFVSRRITCVLDWSEK